MTGILLVHGAWHGPWCWNGVIDRLTESGHDVRAVQLRGHDQPPGRIWYRVRHYVEDVQHMVAAFPAPPFLIGHSLGGLVVQKCLESGHSPGAVLMASVPPRGTVAAVARLAVRHPIEFLKGQSALAPQAVHQHIQAGTRVVLHPRYPARDRRPLLRVSSGRVLSGLYRHDDGSATTTPSACASARSGGRTGLTFHRRRGAQDRACLSDRG